MTNINSKDRALFAGLAMKNMDVIGKNRLVINSISSKITGNEKSLYEELFGSSGIMQLLSTLKGFGISKFKSLAKEIHDQKRKLTPHTWKMEDYTRLILERNLTSNPNLKNSDTLKEIKRLNNYARSKSAGFDLSFLKGDIYRDSNHRQYSYSNKQVNLCNFVFVKESNGRIGVRLKKPATDSNDRHLLKNAIFVQYEPQERIKKLYSAYKEYNKTYNKMFSDVMGKFILENAKESKYIAKSIWDYTEFLEFVKSRCQKYLKIKVINDESRPEDIAKVRFATICTELQYNPPTEKEILDRVTQYRKEYYEKLFPEVEAIPVP